MREKKYSDLRYKYIQWDGIWDTTKEEYCSWFTIEKVMNDKNNEIKVWKEQYDRMKKKYQRCKNGKKEA